MQLPLGEELAPGNRLDPLNMISGWRAKYNEGEHGCCRHPSSDLLGRPSFRHRRHPQVMDQHSLIVFDSGDVFAGLDIDRPS
jgi:hypothetical protein